MSSSPEDVYNRISQILSGFYRISLAAVMLTLIVSILFSNLLAQPIVSLTNVVKDVSLQNSNQKAMVYSKDEIGLLTESVNSMITKLYHTDDMRKKFVSNVSHELRTPITSLKIISETMLDKKPNDIHIYEDFMEDISGELDRLNTIIDTLLNLTNLEKSELKLDFQLIDVNQLIWQCIYTLRPIANKKQIAIYYEDADATDQYCDGLKIRQCLINIINNAIKYTPERGRINVELSTNREYLMIKVKDSGIGIPEKDIPYIFDRFYRVDSARSRETGGSGLGLSIAQQIVTLHQGNIEVQSDLNRGTQFIIILPRRYGP